MELAGDVTGAFWIRSAVRDQDQLQRRGTTTSGSRYNAICRSRGKLPDKCLRIIMARQDPRHPTSPKNTKAKAIPHQANTFTDASVLLPRMPWAACAGIGIVHIDRDLITEPIHCIEEEMTEMRSDPARRYGTMSSAINNFTRMELTAIIATYAPRPIAIAIDSQAVVKGFRRTKDGRSKPSHWINRPDGDLWVFWESGHHSQWCEHHTCEKGSQDIRHSKTRTVAGYPGTTREATTWPTSWLGTRVRTTTTVWPSTRSRRSRGTKSIESWYTGYTNTCYGSPADCECQNNQVLARPPTDEVQPARGHLPSTDTLFTEDGDLGREFRGPRQKIDSCRLS